MGISGVEDRERDIHVQYSKDEKDEKRKRRKEQQGAVRCSENSELGLGLERRGFEEKG
jgi:hypothetical protein